MAHSLFTLRRILAVAALALALSVAALSAGAVAAESLSLAQPQAGAANRTAITDSEIRAILLRNLALGIRSIDTTFSNGIYTTTITLGDGTTITGCHDKLLNPIPCP